MSTLPDAAARDAALDLSAHALVMAPAGSGKTGLLVHRLLRALAVVDAPEQVVAITFTRKAAAEIRARVLDALHAAHQPAATPHEQALRQSARAVIVRDAQLGWQLLAQPGRLNALTIDSFCAQIGAQLPLLSGLGGSIALADDPRGLYLEAITRLFEEIEDASVPRADRAALERLLRCFGNRLDRLIEPLSGLVERREQWLPLALASDAQWAAQDERALSGLIAAALAEFQDSLDAADRAALAGLLREGSAHHARLAWAADLHGWPEARAEHLPTLRALADILLTSADKPALRKPGGVNVNTGFVRQLPYTLRFKALLEARQGDHRLETAAIGVRALPDPELPEDLRALRGAWLRVLRRLAAHLRVVFAEQQRADFPQLAQSATQALRPAGESGAAALAADRRIRHLLVDEMQDTSETQLDLLLALTEPWTAGDGRSLFLVGDPQQSIYAFRKAEVRLFLRLWQEQRLGDLPLRCLRLSANFRSQPAVVAWFNDAFTRIFPQRADVQRGAVPFSPSVALRGAEGEGGVSLLCCADAGHEAQVLAEEAARRVSPERSVVVLARYRSHLEPVIRALRARGLTPACQDIDPLAALPEVRDVLALARALWHPEDRLSWAVLLRAPFVGLSWAQLVALSRGRASEPWPARIAQALDAQTLDPEGMVRLRRLQDALETTAANRTLRGELADHTEAVWLALQGPACASRAALDDVREALRCLGEETRGGGIRDLARLERRLGELYAAPRAGQVQLMTVHKAKGLEFDHVLIAGLNRRVRSQDKPTLHLRAVGDATLFVPRPDEAWPKDHPAHRVYNAVHALHSAGSHNESLRLLYVALTRARRTATLVMSAQLKTGTPHLKYEAGSFAALLQPVIGAQAQAQQPSQPASLTAAAQDLAPPRAPRLPPGLTLPDETGLYRPAATRTLRPSEAVLNAQEDPGAKRDEGDLYAQLVGTLYHEAMQRIAGEGLAAWADAGESRRGSMAAGLRRRGMPEPQVGPAVDRVIELLRRTLASGPGRWLVSPKPWARSELPLAGMRDGRWVSAVIDRCFQDEDDRLWVIDYKTSAQPVEAAALDRYVAAGVEKYRAQVNEYVGLLAAFRPGHPVSGALYFAEADRLVELAHG